MQPESAAQRSGGKQDSKSAGRASGLPTDHLPNHGTSAAFNTLYPSFYGAVTEYLRGIGNLYGAIL